MPGLSRRSLDAPASRIAGTSLIRPAGVRFTRAPCALLVSLACLLSACASPSPGAAPGPHGSRIMRHEGDVERRDRGAGGRAAPGPVLDIRFNVDVVEGWLRLVEAGEPDVEEVRAWVALPGNRELLRLGRRHGTLTPARLEEAALAALRGEEDDPPPPLGRLGVGPWSLLADLAGRIRDEGPDLAVRTARAVGPYLPGGRDYPPIDVFFHLGGQWDGRSHGAVYINLTLFQSRGAGSLPGLDALLVHEVFHQAQAAVLAGVEDYSSAQSTLFTALLRIQQEGTARYVEYSYLEVAGAGAPIDATHLDKYRDGLRHSADGSAVLESLLRALDDGDLRRARLLLDEGLKSGGPLYAFGHAMARMIDRRLGRQALIATVGDGPLAFFDRYLEAVRSAGQPSILPARLTAKLDDLRRGYGGSWLEASRQRRRGLLLIREGRLEEAISALRAAAAIDATDWSSAYNLGCAYALSGRPRSALRWLERAIDRGFDDVRLMRTDADLEHLRGDARFERLLRRLTGASGLDP